MARVEARLAAAHGMGLKELETEPGLPDGQMVLRIDFAAPSPLGLLTGGVSG